MSGDPVTPDECLLVLLVIIQVKLISSYLILLNILGYMNIFMKRLGSFPVAFISYEFLKCKLMNYT